MRLEDKSLERRDVVDNQQAELLEQAQIDEFGEQRFRTRAQGGSHIPDEYAEAVQAAAPVRTEVFATMRDIFDGKEIMTLSQLDPIYQRAVEMLAAAVRGHHPRDRTFVFAEDRRMMLEQSLAALQPMLAMGPMTMMDRHAQGLTNEFERLLGDVNGLRLELAKLEATQEEYEPVAVVGKAKGGDDDTDADDDADADTEAEPEPEPEPDDVQIGDPSESTRKPNGGNAGRGPAATKPTATVGSATRKPAKS